jgi:hypothetical protein
MMRIGPHSLHSIETITINVPLFKKLRDIIFFYVLLPYIIYFMQSRHFSQYPAFISLKAKERDKKYIVKSPQRYKM